MDSYGCELAMSNKFPGKLWRMVNNCKSGAICWGQGGQTVIIHQTKFQDEFLDPPNGLFKTTNIGSFIRQLNLYGFRKLNVVRYAETGAELREVHEFQNDYFIQGRPEMLSRLRRNVGIRRSREMAVKRQLDEIHNYSQKKQRLLEMQGTQYLSVPPSYFSRTHDYSDSSGTDSNSSVGYQAATATGHWPVYMQWDGQSFKYVVLPDASKPPQQQPPTRQQQTLVQPILQTRRSTDGETFQVLHLPDSGGGEAPEEYYLLSLVADNSGEQQQVSQYSTIMSQQSSNATHNPTVGSNTGQEYSPSELYKLAELLASDRQCAIAAAQQLLAQVNQDPSASKISDKGDGASVSWSSPVTTPTWTQQYRSFFSGNSSPASPAIKIEENPNEPKVVVTTNEEAMKPRVLQSLLYNSHLERPFVVPTDQYQNSMDQTSDQGQAVRIELGNSEI